MNIFKKIKDTWAIYTVIKNLKGANMKALLSTWAGWLKVIGYGATIIGLGMGWIDTGLALKISLILSAVVKIAQEIVKLTPSTVDDERLAEVIKLLKEKGVLKVA